MSTIGQVASVAVHEELVVADVSSVVHVHRGKLPGNDC